MAAPPIFIVDDDTDLREILGELLSDEGWAPQLCPNGRAALDLLRGGARPQVILLDLMMPEMDGFQLVAAMKRNPAWRRTPVIVITARDLSAEDRARLDSGIQTVLMKEQFSPAELIERVRQMAADARRVRKVPEVAS